MSNDFVKSVEPPMPDTHCVDTDTGEDVWSYSQELLIDYANKVADAILAKLAEGAESVGEVVRFDGHTSVSGRMILELPHGTKLYAMPPDAQAQIDAANQLAADATALADDHHNQKRAMHAKCSELQAELADAIDVKGGCGPTALSMVIAERDKLIQAVADHVTVRAEQQAELAKRDARIEELEKVVRKYIGALDSWDGSGKAERYTKRCEYDMRAAIAQEQAK